MHHHKQLTNPSCIRRLLLLDGEFLMKIFFSNAACPIENRYMNNFFKGKRIAITVHPKEVGGETFQIASNKERTVNELVEIIQEELAQFTSEKRIVDFGSRLQGDVMRNFSDTSKAKRLLGWETKYELRKGVRKTTQYFVDMKAATKNF